MVKSADDPFQNYLYNTCLETESYWIGKDPKSVEANCDCKAKTEEKLADPAFKQAVMEQKPYEKFPFGDPASYQAEILTACPKLRPLMIDAVCNDPAAPKSACDDIKKMVKGLK
ncbi:MAG TPA: hypothetical protein PLR41_06180 [Alphaproteobacteria bacterium]|nr:hypothetical protein [Alphaproteobacteria bacterium]